MAGEFVPGSGGKDCTKQAGGWGIPMSDLEYIWYANASQSDYPDEACIPYYHQAAQIDTIQVNSQIIGDTCTAVNLPASTITCTNLHASGVISGPTIVGLTAAVATAQATANSKKAFDIPHPTKQGHRLRHICLEGPEAGVYVRGRLTGQNVIELPEYWRGLVDPETITVTLTQIKTSQDLIVDSIEWGTRIKVRSGNGTGIDCYYHVQAERKDGEKLIPEYEGGTFEDYPGDNSQYTCNK